MGSRAEAPALPYTTSDRTSFAFISARDRWPVIVTGAIDDVHRTIVASDHEPRRKEGKAILEALAKLKYELQHDRHLTYENPSMKLACTLLTVSDRWSMMGSQTYQILIGNWIYWQVRNGSACHGSLQNATFTARRVYTSFSLSNHWKTYDVFSRQKMSTFRSSRPAVLELAAKYNELISQLERNTSSTKNPKELDEADEAERMLFTEMCEICLWGNATDLSLLTSLTYEDIQKLQGADARKRAEKNILVNDLPPAYKVLKEAQRTGKEDRPVDIVLDNAGFELFVDLILAGYLLAAGLATRIILHPKTIPWFVSDVIPEDFAALLSALADPQGFCSRREEYSDQIPERLSEKEASNLSFLFRHWAGFHAEGQLVLRPNLFWTSAHSYWHLPQAEPRLYEDLKDSELVIFKGDLNYRKLTADAMWDPTTPFATAIGPMGPASNVRTLALRTCKADTVVGLPGGADEKLMGMEGGGGDSGARKWAWSGKWAVVQFCDGKA